MTATSTILLTATVWLTEDMISAVLILLVAAVKDVIFGRDDVWLGSIVSIDVAFIEGFSPETVGLC